jgi:uncharacterized protein (TIGR02145 family)
MKNSTFITKLHQKVIIPLAIIILAALIYSCQEDGDLFPTINSEITSEYLLDGNLDVYLDHTQVLRYKGNPGITTIEIGSSILSDYEDCFVLYIANGADSEVPATSAIIKFDGIEVLNASDFSNREVIYNFEICNLSEQSVLEVDVKGAPGSYVDIWIEGKLKTTGSVTDIDGNTYKTVKIGKQWWMAENLATTTYKDGTPIANVIDPIEWGNLTTAAYCWYGNDETSYKDTYGGLYNFYAVETGKLCPDGWHVPSDEEWYMLVYEVGGPSVSGGKLKEAGYEHWLDPNTGATNDFGFTGLPAGCKGPNEWDTFGGMSTNTWFYTSDSWGESGIYHGMHYTIDYDDWGFNDNKRYGYSVRCVKDAEIISEYPAAKNLTIYLNPSRVVKNQGKPGITTIEIGSSNLSDYEDCFVLYIANGDDSKVPVTSAIIKLDGLEVMNASDFSNHEVTYTFEICNLTEQSVLEVGVKGAPGSYVDIWIEGKLKTTGSVTDEDGNIYKTVQIGDQWWMAENLATTTYKDGTPIANVIDPIEWGSLTTAAYCWYGNDETSYKETYGALYNWYAVETGKLCPDGWHVPSDEEWYMLVYEAGGPSVSGGKLKEQGYVHWLNPNIGATDDFGFTGLPAGTRSHSEASFGGISTSTWFWTSDPWGDSGIYHGLHSDRAIDDRGYHYKNSAYSVRCVKNINY